MSKPNDIKAVLFDLDETLIVHSKSFEELAHQTYADFAHHFPGVTAEQFWKIFWPKAVDLWTMMFDGVISGEMARRYTYINTLRALKADESLADEMLERGDVHMVNCTTLCEDTMPVIERLREAGFRLGLVTNGYSRTQRKKIEYYGFHEIMDAVLVSEEVGSHKPHPDIFLEALARVKAEPREALFVGDMPENDILGAMNVGMPAALIDAQGQWQHIRQEQTGPEPTHTIHRLNELIRILGCE